ncbi:MAG: sensor domain-containing protein [Mycobacterium sp.]
MTGSAAIEGTPDVRVGRNIADVLPTHDEMSTALDIAIEPADSPPTVGGAQVLGTGSDYSGDAACAGVAQEAAVSAYRALPIWAVATGNWDSEGFMPPNVFIDVAAIALRSDAAARNAVTAFGHQWQQCQDADVRVVYAAGSGHDLAYRVSAVHTEPAQLSADVVFTTFAGEATIKRAVVVAANCIVDVSVTYYRDDGPAVPNDLAEKVAQLALQRIEAA